MKFKGIILAGGKSSRFGADKARALWEGQPLLERSVALLNALRLEPVVISNQHRDYSFLTCPVFNDLIPDRGPLGGLYTACKLFPERILVVLTCDMPFVNQAVLKHLMESHQSSFRVTVARIGEQIHPFPGIYPTDIQPIIHERLESDKLSMRSFLTSVQCQLRTADIFTANTFKNVNQPCDLGLTIPERLDRARVAKMGPR